MARALHSLVPMTIGQLVSTLYTEFERQFHDQKIAAVATQVALEELLRTKRSPRRA